MMRIPTIFPLTFGFFPLLFHAAFAQPAFQSTQPVLSREQGVTIFGNLSESDVTGEPFSAIEESLYSQKQPDGSYRDRTLYTTHISRDSHGRTRAERYVTSYLHGGVGESRLSSIFIADPVTDMLYRLDPENHVATRMQWNVNTRAHSEHADMMARIASTEELQPRAITQSLGTAAMEGLTVEGIRQTLTVPASAGGYDRTFTIVLETWISPELQVALLARYENSIVGKNTTRLTKIDRSEPDAALFQVPQDYAIQDASTVEGETIGH